MAWRERRLDMEGLWNITGTLQKSLPAGLRRNQSMGEDNSKRLPENSSSGERSCFYLTSLNYVWTIPDSVRRWY